MTANKKPAKRSAAKTARPRSARGEPEEISLWRQIIASRDVLEKSATGWADFLERQRRGHERKGNRLDEMPETMRVFSQEQRQRSDALVSGIVEAHRDQLKAFDITISNLRATRDGKYALRTLRGVAQSFQETLLTEARERVADYIKSETEHDKLQAQAAIACARDLTPRAVDVQGEVHKILESQEAPDDGDRVAAVMWPERVYRPVDLDQLLTDARKERFAKNESANKVPQFVVALALGLKLNERKLRR